MSTFSAKGTDVDVEAIMSNIRRKIEEKRKGLYSEEEVREISNMKLDSVLDASEFNSDFAAAFRARDEKWNFRFDPETIYASSHAGGGGLIRSLRRLLNPVLKLFFNPNPIISALSRQADLNRYYVLLLHNLAQELTRANLEITNLKARLRTLGIRVDFQTKREKTLEQVALTREGRESRPPRMGDRERGSDREPRSERRERMERTDRTDRKDRADRADRERSERGDRERGPRDERGSGGERAASDRDRERGRGRGRRPFRRRRGGGGGGGNRGDGGGRPQGGRSGGGSPSGPREGSGGNRA